MTTTATEFTALVAPHMPRLFRLGMRLTRQPSEADDLVQEALCRAWANWSRFEQGGSVGAYLARIVVNTFISRHRHSRVVTAAATRSDLLDHLFDRGRMQEAHAPEGSWTASLLSDEELVDLQGNAYKEAAQTLDIPLGTVMSRLHRARRLMRDRLSQYASSLGYCDSMVPAAA
jgi:RNA polymerase sigma-70 factor (ECF subfamily)